MTTVADPRWTSARSELALGAARGSCFGAVAAYPYLAWVAFAAAPNATILILNP